MFEEYKIKLNDDKIKVYSDGVLGKNFIFECDEETLNSLKLSKELTKCIEEAIVKREVKAKLKAKKK